MSGGLNLVLHADTVMMSFASGPVSRYRAIGLALLLLAGGAASPAHAGGDTWDGYEAALSYRDAVHGSAEAQADLGARYAEGRGFPQSDERAVHRLTRAGPRRGRAELRLSEFYADGGELRGITSPPTSGRFSPPWTADPAPATTAR